jgi:AraC family transcriptional regulator of adaptative response/methylated-DNA-[protein]-cysteine methyltransferase
VICLTHIETPVGLMMAGATDEGICLFDFRYRRSIDSIMKRIETLSHDTFSEGAHPYFYLLEQQVSEYFAGTRKEFGLPLNLAGTQFQKTVWEGLLDIPYGETRTYKQQALFLGNEKAIRAVAGANGENGLAIIIPCHRVIGANGTLVGYGGGIERKKWLLDHERKYSGKQGELF